MNTQIRALSVADLPALNQLEQRCFSSPWSEQQLQQRLEHPRSFSLAIFEEELQAFALFSTLLDEAELLQVGVSPRLQGQGVGQRLLTAACRALSEQGISRLMLEVRASNISAISLYRKLGFSDDGRRKGYYPGLRADAPREDAILMSLSLNH